ncbi:MAG: hypothetical protein KDC48_18800, partial [Planctomycetes bacterium]|nr:hypothetical protein [Planctomycetota bacterium]
MKTRFLPLLALASAAAAQDFVLPTGYASASGPPLDNYPAARAKDANFDGIILPEEIHAFATVLPTQAPSGVNFMTDCQMVVENGEPVFYFTDSEDGQVVRCRDDNHNGVIDANEAGVFFRFGLNSAGTGGLFAPDTLGVYRDPATNTTRVYAALDSFNATYGRGIYRLVDLNGDGDAMDNGESGLFVAASLGLSVPGVSGPVSITRDFWSQVRVLPGGKVVAYASGAAVNGVLVPNSNPPVYDYSTNIQPEMNCWYGFTDNNGTAVPEVFFNASTLNDLPLNPAFDDPRVPSTSAFPNWDIQVLAQTAQRRCFTRWMDVVPNGGPNGEPVYYFAASYNTLGLGDINLNGQQIGGLVYRAVDSNNNQVIDVGELSLYCNVSTQTYAGVAPISFVNTVANLPVTQFVDRTWGFSADLSGGVHFIYANGGTNEAVISAIDANQNGVIDQGELTMPFYTPTDALGYLSPFAQALGPYFDDFQALPNLLLPGPFPAGVTPIGNGCVSPTSGKEVLMDAFFGGPTVGNANFEVASIRGVPSLPVFPVADFVLAPTPLNLSVFGLPTGCFSYLQ